MEVADYYGGRRRMSMRNPMRTLPYMGGAPNADWMRCAKRNWKTRAVACKEFRKDPAPRKRTNFKKSKRLETMGVSKCSSNLREVPIRHLRMLVKQRYNAEKGPGSVRSVQDLRHPPSAKHPKGKLFNKKELCALLQGAI